MMRVVIDTNVLISSTFWTGSPKRLLNHVRQGRIVFLTSDFILEELKTVLVREDKPFKLTEQEARTVVDAIGELAEKVNVHHRLTVCKHEADNRILECAAQGNVDYIITGDSHLLEMKSFGGIQIFTVADFLNTFISDSV